MHPEQIKAAIRMKGTTPAAIADELGLSRATVSQVIHGRGTSARVASRISQLTGLSISALWPVGRPTLVRRRKTASTKKHHKSGNSHAAAHQGAV